MKTRQQEGRAEEEVLGYHCRVRQLHRTCPSDQVIHQRPQERQENPHPDYVPQNRHRRARRVLEVCDGRRDVVVRGKRRVPARGAARVEEACRREMGPCSQTK
jgi:hypothetical protein